MKFSKSTFLSLAIGIGFLSLGFYFRSSGLFHGLEDGVVFHPDTPKQVKTLEDYLDGKYLTYYNSLFYDGYPYGLNRVDEVLIRGVYTVIRPLNRLFYGDTEVMAFPDRERLYYWARCLRLFYGMVSLMLVPIILYMLTRRKAAALIGLGLYALSPLAATVTHFASGDIGVDFFLSFTLFFLALALRRQQDRWVVAAGLAVGAAFACKYQGALGAWLVAVTLLVRTPAPWRDWKAFLRPAIGSATGFFVGAAALTPGIWIAPEKTLRLMKENFGFIKNYGVPQAFLDKSWGEKVSTSLPDNLPGVLGALGGGLVLISVIAFLLSLKRRKELASDASQPASGPIAYDIAISSFPLMAILLSTTLKPAVQPFHFSYLIPALALSAGLLAAQIAHQKSLLKVCGFWILLGCSLVPLLRSSLTEDFYWRRGALDASVNPYILQPLRMPLHRPRDFPNEAAIKQFYLHPESLSVFRNRPRSVSDPRPDGWRADTRLFVPEIPLYARTPDWIFLKGAAFPLSDHYLHLGSEEPLRTHLVVDAPASRIFHLGFRSGALPVQIHGRLGDAAIQVFLPPHAQTRIELEPSAPVKKIKGPENLPELELYPLQLSASPGEAVVAVLADAGAIERFEQFGPQGSRAGIPAFGAVEKRRLGEIRFMEMDQPPYSLPLPPGMRPETLWLPAGRYQFKAGIHSSGEGRAKLRVCLKDPLGSFPAICSDSFSLPKGYSEISWVFEKGFAPHEVAMEFDLQGAGGRVMDWDLLPLPGRGEEPEAPKDGVDFYPLEIAFPHGLQLSGLGFYRDSDDPHKLFYAIHAEVNDTLSKRIFEELVIFLHLLDQNGEMLQAVDFTLPGASFDPDQAVFHEITLDPGLWEQVRALRLGLYSARTRLRLTPRLSGQGEEGLIRDKKSIRMQSPHPLLKFFHPTGGEAGGEF